MWAETTDSGSRCVKHAQYGNKNHIETFESMISLVSCSRFLFIKECLEIPDTNQSQFKAYKYNPLIILVSSMCDKSLKAK